MTAILAADVAGYSRLMDADCHIEFRVNTAARVEVLTDGGSP